MKIMMAVTEEFVVVDGVLVVVGSGTSCDGVGSQ